MSLRGSLETIALPDVLNLLASTGKSGELSVHTPRGDGRLWFDAGRLSDHDVAHCPEVVDAVFELLRSDDGTFDFSDRAERTGGHLHDVGPVLAAAQERLQEWQEIAEVVPSVAHRVRLVDEPGRDRVELDAHQWALVVAIGEGAAVRHVLDRRHLGEFDGCRAIKVLVEANLACLDAPAETQVNAEVAPSLGVGDLRPLGALPSPSGPGPEAHGTGDGPDPLALRPALLGPEAGQLLAAALAEAAGSDDAPVDAGQGVERAADPDPADVRAAEEQPGGEAATGPVPGDAQEALRAMLRQVSAGDEAEGADQVAGSMPEPEPASWTAARGASPAGTAPGTTEPAGTEPASTEPGTADWPAPAAAADGLSDRGPWTSGELAGLDHSDWWPGQPDASGEATAAETAEPAEEPINRGLLLKFLSSVRN